MIRTAELVVTRWRVDHINGQPKLIIEQVKALDENGKYIKFISMAEARELLDILPVTFKPAK